MNFDDTAKFFGPSHRLWPELFSNRTEQEMPVFPCLMCDTRMIDMGKQWECPRCGFFYKPLVPGTVPRKYSRQEQSIKRLCMTGRGKDLGQEPKCRRRVTGTAQYCEACATNRERARKRESKGAKRGHSPISAEALTNAES
jgi:hypothetical protein